MVGVMTSKNYRLAGQNATSVSVERLSTLGKQEFEICSKSEGGPSLQLMAVLLEPGSRAQRLLSQRPVAAQLRATQEQQRSDTDDI